MLLVKNRKNLIDQIECSVSFVIKSFRLDKKLN